MCERGKPSEKTVRVLRLIAVGHSYAQIIDGGAGLSYRDVFAAAREALELLGAEWPSLAILRRQGGSSPAPTRRGRWPTTRSCFDYIAPAGPSSN